MKSLMKQFINRSLVLVAISGTIVLGTGGCPDELAGTAVDAFQTGYEIGSGDWGSGYGSWDGGYDYGSGYGSSNDNYDNNWYTDTSYNGDADGFYIAGDGFSYISGW